MKQQQQPLIGFLFALTAAIAWGTLPIALKQVLSAMNTQTIVWYRFVVASIALLLLLWYKKELPRIKDFAGNLGCLAILGIFGLAGNFFLFNISLNYIEPAVSQIFINLTSFIMLLCGVVFFKEQLGLHQKIGLVVLIIGLGLFFNHRLEIFTTLNKYSIGVAISITSSFVWVTYGLSQKLMLRRLSSQQILLVMYIGCTVLFTPVADFHQIEGLTPFAWGCFIYCCLNTLFGYGAYAEALDRWDVSKVSVVITLVPLFTILFAHIIHYINPEHFAEPDLNALSYVGALVVVCGAMLSAIGHKLFPHKA